MKVDLERINKSKREFRRRLAARPIAEKLRLLDSLRERLLAIRRGPNTGTPTKAVIQETAPSAERSGLP
jgi:hypothetical protein